MFRFTGLHNNIVIASYLHNILIKIVVLKKSTSNIKYNKIL